MLLIMTVIIAISAGWLFYKNRNGLGFCALILLIAGQGLLIMDAMQHFGTNLQTIMTSEKVAPIVDIKGNKVMVTERIKQGKTVYTAYATKKPATAKITTILNRYKRVNVTFNTRNGVASKVTKNEQYNYVNNWAKLMYSGITNNHQLKQQTITYRLTSDWHLLNKHELTKVARILKAKATQQKLKNYVAGHIKQQVQKKPQLAANKQEMQQLENEYMKKYIGGIIKKAAD